jgi:hypothetical protein
MITNFSTTIKQSEKIIEAQNSQSTMYLENIHAKKLIFVRSWDLCFQVRTIKKSIILERST